MRRLFAFALVLAFVPAAVAADATDLLKYIPPQANTVAVINVAHLFASPRAAKEGWAKLDHTEYLAGAVPLNPSLSRLVLVKEMHPDHLAGGSVLAIRETNDSVDLAKVVKLSGGTAITLGDEPAVTTPRGTYYVKLADKVLGSVRPEGKQDVARWVRFAKTNTQSVLNRSINAAVARSEKNHITVAVEIEDLFDDGHAVAAVALAKSLKSDPVQMKLVEKFAVGLTVAVFTANITGDGIRAAVRLESKAVDAKLNADLVKAFVIETLGHSGMMLEDLVAAKAEKGDNSVSLTFLISDPELAKVMSLVIPTGMLPANGESIAVAPGGATAAATTKYFSAVNAIVDQLKKQNEKAEDYEKTAVWHDTAAGKIETLSVLGVDKAVVEYGLGTANRLRMIADSLEGVPAKVEELQGQAWAFRSGTSRVRLTRGGFRYNPWGGTYTQTNLGEIRAKQAAAVKQDKSAREKLWLEIDAKRTETKAAIK